MISCDFISKYYLIGLLHRRKKEALKSVTFKVQRNEVFGVIGLNGAGKSSLLKVLMGFVRPDSGSVQVAGSPAGSAANRRLIGYLPEHPSLYPNLSVTEHLQFAARVGGLSNQQTTERIRTVLDQVGLSEVAKTPIKRFSKGMTQRAALAYAILLEPEILILDEPMSGLDPLGRQLVIDLIRACKTKGTTILFCSHILTDVERICDRIGIMHRGQLVTVIDTPLDTKGISGTSAGEDGKTPLESFFLQTVQA